MIDEKIKELQPIYLDFLSQLIKIPSEFGNERKAQVFVKQKMKKLKLDVNEYLSRKDRESISLSATKLGSDSKNYRSIVLNAHCDIVPVDDEKRWRLSPFSGKIIKDKIFGRGALDDKSGIAIILMIADVFYQLGLEHKGDIIFQSVIEDETKGNGAKSIMKGESFDGVIIVDGTWSGSLIYGHLGRASFDIEIQGFPVAACVEGRGINPIYIAIDLINKIKKYISEENKKCPLYEDIKKPFYLNVGKLESGKSSMSVPSRAKLEIQIGFPPPLTPEGINKKVKDIAKSISNNIKITLNENSNLPFIVDKNSEFIKKLEEKIKISNKDELKKFCVTGHSDMQYFKTENVCLYGPGGGKNPHGIDEFYFISEMPKVVKNIILFLLDWCNENKVNV